MPGGAIEKDESPLAAAKRESIEEIGFEKVTAQLLIVNYISTLGYKSETIHFVFRGEALTEEDIKAIELPKEELKQFRCATLEEAQKVTSKVLREMLPIAFEALKSNKTHYIEGTTEIPSI
jgi:8-oxo-dGTP pyrophosphatase MutT (NUDIX family)